MVSLLRQEAQRVFSDGSRNPTRPNTRRRMSNITFICVLAILAGAMMPTQAAINNKMAVVVDSPILAALISFFVGTIGYWFMRSLRGHR